MSPLHRVLKQTKKETQESKAVIEQTDVHILQVISSECYKYTTDVFFFMDMWGYSDYANTTIGRYNLRTL